MKKLKTLDKIGDVIDIRKTMTNKKLSLKPDAADVAKGGGTVKFADKVSRQKMARHLKGSSFNDSKGYFNSIEDAQKVLDSYKSGNYRLISENPGQNQVTIQVNGVTGRHVSKAAPGTNQVDINVPTNIFTIQSSSAPKPIPVNPNKGL